MDGYTINIDNITYVTIEILTYFYGCYSNGADFVNPCFLQIFTF